MCEDGKKYSTTTFYTSGTSACSVRNTQEHCVAVFVVFKFEIVIYVV